jgi:serine/threonine protein kinase
MPLPWKAGRRPRRKDDQLFVFQEGRKLGRYELLGPLGSGGMADVWRAKTVGPGGFERQVVIKCIRPGHQADPEFVRLFLDEAQILGLLHHPNVVQVHEFAEAQGALFLVLEYVDGPSVSRVLRALQGTGRRVPPAIAAYVAREVCRALDYVHALNDADGTPLAIVHRDVTPSNIVFTASGGLKLLDFGVAKFRRSEPLTRAGTVRGKPAYLAPEQLEGGAIDGRVDLFALGIVLHEMLSLEHLFAGDSDLITVRKVMEMEIPRPSSRSAAVPAALDAIVMKALERDRDKRYRSAGEMARDLDEYVVSSRLHVDEVVAFLRSIDESLDESRAIEEAPTVRELAMPSFMVGRARRPARRTRRRASAIAAAVVVAAVATAFGLRVNITATKNLARASETAAVEPLSACVAR